MCSVVRKVAEPIDRAGCRTHCGLVDMEMLSYDYDTDTCLCVVGGVEVER